MFDPVFTAQFLAVDIILSIFLTCFTECNLLMTMDSGSENAAIRDILFATTLPAVNLISFISFVGSVN